MFLYELKEGQRAEISELFAEGEFSSRLRDMGFCEGEEIMCVKKAVFKSPVLYKVKGSLIALRKAEAEKIEVVL